MKSPTEERPPFFRTWRALYSAIILYLAVLIALFAAFTRSYNR